MAYCVARTPRRTACRPAGHPWRRGGIGGPGTGSRRSAWGAGSGRRRGRLEEEGGGRRRELEGGRGRRKSEAPRGRWHRRLEEGTGSDGFVQVIIIIVYLNSMLFSAYCQSFYVI